MRLVMISIIALMFSLSHATADNEIKVCHVGSPQEKQTSKYSFLNWFAEAVGNCSQGDFVHLEGVPEGGEAITAAYLCDASAEIVIGGPTNSQSNLSCILKGPKKWRQD